MIMCLVAIVRCKPSTLLCCHGLSTFGCHRLLLLSAVHTWASHGFRVFY